MGNYMPAVRSRYGHGSPAYSARVGSMPRMVKGSHVYEISTGEKIDETLEQKRRKDSHEFMEERIFFLANWRDSWQKTQCCGGKAVAS